MSLIPVKHFMIAYHYIIQIKNCAEHQDMVADARRVCQEPDPKSYVEGYVYLTKSS